MSETKDTLSITDNRTGEAYEVEIPTRRSAPWICARSR